MCPHSGGMSPRWLWGSQLEPWAGCLSSWHPGEELVSLRELPALQDSSGARPEEISEGNPPPTSTDNIALNARALKIAEAFREILGGKDSKASQRI